MLSELKVNQFAIIDHLHLQFQPGLNIISGETGAGKSVLLRSLSLLMGAKASSDFIRTGSAKAQIEGRFDLEGRSDVIKRLEELDLGTNENDLIVRRIIGPGDKNKVYLNGSLSTVSALRDIVAPLIEVAGQTAPLIEMTGQHENKNLLQKSYHLDVLDQFANLFPQREHYDRLWNEHRALKSEIQALETLESSRLQRIDFLNFQRSELTSVPLLESDEADFEIRIKRLRNRQKLIQYYGATLQALDEDEDSALTRIQKVLSKGHDFEAIEPELTSQFQNLSQALAIIQEVSYGMNKALETISFEDENLELLEAQMSHWRKLQKKYGTSAQEMNLFLINVEKELEQLLNSEKHLSQLKQKAAKIETNLHSLAEDMHALREGHAMALTKTVNHHLRDLNMKGVIFGIHINKSKLPISTGFSDVEFVSQTSANEPERPLSKVASGGELSRILLSLKCVLGASQFPRTYLFDEVDSGVSGVTADRVARKLHQISRGQQVICVTHLPQVAAFGDHHFSIQKVPNSKKGVEMEVKFLKDEDRIFEIARLISGESITKTSLAHARALLKKEISRVLPSKSKRKKAPGEETPGAGLRVELVGDDFKQI